MEAIHLTIRQATRSDAPDITRLHAAGWREGYGSFFEPEVLELAIEERRTRWSDLLSKSDLGGTLLFVGEQAGKIVTFAHAGPPHGHPDGLEIYSFYAHPRHWGTGAARHLMLFVLEFARTRGYERIYLSAYSGSARARRFYEKLGFRETGRKSESRLPRDVVLSDVEYVHEGPLHHSAAEIAAPRDRPQSDR